jgi:protocatechuate 3,4-dioxygenase beta subunit
VVTLNSLYRADITTDPSGTYAQRLGIPLQTVIKLVNTSNSCAPLVGYDVYVWHCDADGYYSYYTVAGYLGTKSYANGYFLRGVQTTDACGEVSFNTIFPGWYTGRYPHLHIAVSISGTSEAVTQMTWPAATLATVYADASVPTNSTTYSAHGQPDTTFAADMVFQGNAGQIATISGSDAAGYQSQWVLGIAM